MVVSGDATLTDRSMPMKRLLTRFATAHVVAAAIEHQG
jgi:hypothetical protein